MLTIFKCKKCGKLAIFMGEVEGPVTCGGEEMRRMKAGEVDAAAEKHVPVVSIDGNAVTVKVGEVEHPMTEAHLIDTIILETTNGYQVKALTAADKPEATFVLADGEAAVAAYEYCNLHGLWKKAL